VSKKPIFLDEDVHYKLKLMAITRKVTMMKMIQILINDEAVKNDKQ
jgi:hypothetical protein